MVKCRAPRGFLKGHEDLFSPDTTAGRQSGGCRLKLCAPGQAAAAAGPAGPGAAPPPPYAGGAVAGTDRVFFLAGNRRRLSLGLSGTAGPGAIAAAGQR